jgi:hypothetical protein
MNLEAARIQQYFCEETFRIHVMFSESYDPANPQGHNADASSSRARIRPPPAHPMRVVNGLERKYMRILAEIKRFQDAQYDWVGVSGFAEAEKYYWENMRRLKENLAAVDRAIRLFDPKWPRKSLMRPMRAYSLRRRVSATDFQASVLTVMEEAAVPLKIADITKKVAADLDLPTKLRDQRQRLYNQTYSFLRGYEEKGFAGRDSGAPARWYLIPDK